MTDLQIDIPEEKEEETLLGTILLRSVVSFLCALFGFVLIVLGYACTLLMDLDSEKFSNYTFVYFFISLTIWILIGLFTPFTSIQRFFEQFKGVTPGRIAAFLIILGLFILLHWYIITLAAELVVSIFSIE